MIDAPFDAPATHANRTCESAGVAVTDVGTAGVVNGVDVAIPLATPTPAPLMALTRNPYC